MSLKTRLILASNSPRRQELLRSAGFDFEVFTRDFDESFPDELSPMKVAEYLARHKNEQYRKLLPADVIVTADTTVIHRQRVLNKPADELEAFDMIKSLADDMHEVVCGVCISSPVKTISFTDITEVEFLPMNDDEINYYINEYRPFDKAGAYGIQEWIGLTKVKSIKGSFYNVMGLPVHRVYEVLKGDFGASYS